MARWAVLVTVRMATGLHSPESCGLEELSRVRPACISEPGDGTRSSVSPGEGAVLAQEGRTLASLQPPGSSSSLASLCPGPTLLQALRVHYPSLAAAQQGSRHHPMSQMRGLRLSQEVTEPGFKPWVL